MEQPQLVDGDAFLRNVLVFGRELKAEGLAADLATVLDYARALELVDIGDREEVRAAGAALFVRRHDELEPYDVVFARFWRRQRQRRAAGGAQPQRREPDNDAPTSDGVPSAKSAQPSATLMAVEAEEGGEPEGETPTVSPTSWSAYESLRTKSFERMTAAEMREAELAIDAMSPTLPMRRTRRWDLDRRGTLLAPRAMLRRNLSNGGDLVEWVWRRPVRRPRHVIILCDISGSMERHSRLLLRFGHALARSRVKTEAFVFGTRLTRITPLLKQRNPDDALRDVAEAVGDWSGGTRIGGAFREFNLRWARRVLRSSGIVIVISDGWDRGDPAVVGAETARLKRNCHRLIWLNPLAGTADYRPLAAGMAAAYPHIDRFLPAHDLASLEVLADLLSREAFLPVTPSVHTAGVAAAMASQGAAS